MSDQQNDQKKVNVTLDAGASHEDSKPITLTKEQADEIQNTVLRTVAKAEYAEDVRFGRIFAEVVL